MSDEEKYASVLPLGNPPFQLEFFQWVCAGMVTRHDIGVLRFLTSQPSLKTLSIQGGGSEFPQISSLQNLRNLDDVIGTVTTILPLLPRTVPIKRMHCWSTGDIEGDLDRFPLLKDLRVLSFTYYIPRPPLSVIIQRFGAIKVLSLYALCVCYVILPSKLSSADVDALRRTESCPTSISYPSILWSLVIRRLLRTSPKSSTT